MSFVACAVVSLATLWHTSIELPAWMHWLQLSICMWCWWNHGRGKLRMIAHREFMREIEARIPGPQLAELDAALDELMRQMIAHNRRKPDGKRIQA